MRIRNILIAGSLGLLFFFTGCKKIDKNIVGSWDYQTMGNTSIKNAMWIFKNDGVLIRNYWSPQGNLYSDTCVYTVKTNLFKKELTIKYGKILSIGVPDVSGVYKIENFDNDKMILTRSKLDNGSKSAAYLRCEMKKIKG